MEGVVNASGRVLLHAGRNVRIEVERDADFGMPEALARHLRMHARRKQVRSVSVAQVMEPHAWHAGPADQCLPIVRERSRLYWLAILSRVDERFAMRSNA